jgi:hypothetical protein
MGPAAARKNEEEKENRSPPILWLHRRIYIGKSSGTSF